MDVIVNKKVPKMSEKIPHLFYRERHHIDAISRFIMYFPKYCLIVILSISFYNSSFSSSATTAAVSFLGRPRRLVEVIRSLSFIL